MIDNAAFSAPVILTQLLLFMPISLALLDAATSGAKSFGRIMRQTLRNPMLIGSLLGALVAAFDIQLPGPVLAPLEILGGAAVPLMLLAFGISLGGERPLQPGTGRREQGQAQLALQALQVACQCRLHQTQAARGLGDRARVGHGHEGAQQHGVQDARARIPARGGSVGRGGDGFLRGHAPGA